MNRNFTMGVFACALWLTAAAQAAQPTAPIVLSAEAPDAHVVVKGDTLWDISARFLKSPWQWPELWRLNREQIANPHLIYPGDVVYLDRSGDRPRLRLGKAMPTNAYPSAADSQTLRLSPRTRAAPIGAEAIPTLNLAAVEPFLNRPLIVDEAGLASHPRIVATQDGRLYLSRGDLAYARGLPSEPIGDWHVYRPAKPLLDPVSRKPIAWETLFVGTAQMVREGDPATLRIMSNNEEVGEGDRLMPAVPTALPKVAPHPPANAVDGQVLSVYRGLDSAGKNNVVAVSAGSDHGLEVGHVLVVQNTGRIVLDRDTKEQVRLPNEPIGQLVIFRVFNRIAYGLVVSASQAIAIGATVATP